MVLLFVFGGAIWMVLQRIGDWLFWIDRSRRPRPRRYRYR